MQIFRYIYYRTAHAYINYGWRKSFSFDCCEKIIACCVSMNCLSVALIAAYLLVDNMQSNFVLYVAVPCVIVSMIFLNRIFMTDDNEMYDMLHLKYKDEKHRIIKGCLVLLYIVASIFGGISIYILVVN